MRYCKSSSVDWERFALYAMGGTGERDLSADRVASFKEGCDEIYSLVFVLKRLIAFNISYEPKSFDLQHRLIVRTIWVAYFS